MASARRAALTGVIGLVAVLGLAVPRSAAARPLPYELSLDLPLTVLGGAAWIGSEVFKEDLASPTCRWCEVPGLDASVRRRLKWSDIDTADHLSNVTGFVLTPLATFGLTALSAGRRGGGEQLAVDALVIVQAMVLAADLNQLTKILVARERPFVHALPPELKAQTKHPADNNLSFFSGHATFTFSLAVSSGTVASMRGYRAAPWIWAGGLTLAATSGYLRIAADRHYLTDVLVGAAVGSAVGFALPYFAHRAH